jgi:hypothetical protein
MALSGPLENGFSMFTRINFWSDGRETTHRLFASWRKAQLASSTHECRDGKLLPQDMNAGLKAYSQREG